MRRLVFIMVLLCPVSAWALQIDQPGWSFSQRFQGTSNASGTILKSDTTVAGTMNRYMDLYIGLPIYFTRPDDIIAPGGDARFLNGVGNLYVGIQTPIQSEVGEYVSDIVVQAPTGSKERGLNTGNFLFDWNNNLQRAFGSVTPFGNAGFGNTIADSAFFVRPFTSLGLNVHFEGGANLAAGQIVSVGGSAYSIRAIGTQRVVSRLVDRPFFRGPGPGLGRDGRVYELTPDVRVPSNFLHDHGISTWIGINPDSEIRLQVGYSRSFPYDYDSLFFGIGYRFGSLIR